MRNLAVHMDQHLNMTDHVTAVCAACNYHLYRLSPIRHYLTTEAKKTVVNALSSTMQPGTRTSKHDHITPVLKELHWLPVESRIAFKMLIMTFKCIIGLAPSYLAELVQPRKRSTTPELCANIASRHNKEVYWRFDIWRYSTTTVE